MQYLYLFPNSVYFSFFICTSVVLLFYYILNKINSSTLTMVKSIILFLGSDQIYNSSTAL